jgi:hypothetical protein
MSRLIFPRVAHFLVLWLLMFLSACTSNPDTAHSPVAAHPLPQRLPSAHDDSLMPAHFVPRTRQDTAYVDIPADTITPRRTFLRYRVTQDSCCSDNVYLQWGNPTWQRTYLARSVRTYRSYFTPMLVQETPDYLVLWQGCATDCFALLFLPLNQTEPPQNIDDVVGYNLQNYTVVHGLLGPEQENEKEFVQAYNVKTKQKKRIVFHHAANRVAHSKAIDSCWIDAHHIYLRATLAAGASRQQEVVERLTLPNDIRPQ